jgi:hypothetical protein
MTPQVFIRLQRRLFRFTYFDSYFLRCQRFGVLNILACRQHSSNTLREGKRCNQLSCLPSPPKKNRKRKEKGGTPLTTPENCGKRQYRNRKFSLTTKLWEPLISCVNSTCLSFMNRTRAKEEEENGNSSAFVSSKWPHPLNSPA